jgi:DNA-binding transcriptional MerR regulator
LDRVVDKAPDAFRTISEVADDLDLPQHVLRFWETRFIQIRPMKRGGGRRFYRREDVELLRGIRHLLYGEGYTIRGVQRILKDHGVKFVQSVWQAGAPQPDKIPVDEEATDAVGEAAAPERGRRLFGLLPLRQDNAAAPPAETAVERPQPPADAEPARERPEVAHHRRPPVAAAEGPAAHRDRNAAHVAADAAGAHAPLRPARAAGLARDDVRKLEATLRELEECRRLLDEGLDTSP